MKIILKDGDERGVMGVIEMDPRERTPNIKHGHDVFQASRQEDADTFIYRHVMTERK